MSSQLDFSLMDVVFELLFFHYSVLSIFSIKDVCKARRLKQESRDLYQGVWNNYLARTGDSLTAIRASLSKAAASTAEAETNPSAAKSLKLVEGLGETQSPLDERTAEKGLSKTKAAPEPSESIQASNIKISHVVSQIFSKIWQLTSQIFKRLIPRQTRP